MSATLSIISNFSLPLQGITVTGKQGNTTDAATVAWTETVTGAIKDMIGTLATATVATVYNSSNDLPATFGYLFYWADQDSYIQIIGSGTNAIFKVAAKTPFWLPGNGTILAAANTTPIAGNSQPVLTNVASVVIGNYSGQTLNYRFAVIN